MAQVHRHRVRYHEVDQQGFLFNGHFLEIADVCLVEVFRRLGWRYDDLIASGTDPSVVKSEITFERPARFDDVLDVDAAPTHVGRSSFTLSMVLRRDGQVVATVNNTYVNVDAATATSRPLPSDVAAALHAMAPAPGAERVR
jgi:acyl-CoA thioester hydrolase